MSCTLSRSLNKRIRAVCVLCSQEEPRARKKISADAPKHPTLLREPVALLCNQGEDQALSARPARTRDRRASPRQDDGECPVGEPREHEAPEVAHVVREEYETIKNHPLPHDIPTPWSLMWEDSGGFVFQKTIIASPKL